MIKGNSSFPASNTKATIPIIKITEWCRSTGLLEVIGRRILTFLTQSTITRVQGSQLEKKKDFKSMLLLKYDFTRASFILLFMYPQFTVFLL